MGRTRTFVGTSVSRAIEDGLVPNSMRSAIENSVLRKADIPENIVAGLADSLGVRPHRMYDFAKRGMYTHGLPSGQFYTPNETGEDALLTVLRQIEGPGPDLVIKYLHHGSPNTLHYGWMKLITDYGYNTANNQLAVLTALKGSPVYLENMVVVTPLSGAPTVDTDTLNQWGISPLAGATPDRAGLTGAAAEAEPHSPVEVSSSISSDQLKVTYVWGLPGLVSRETIVIPVTGLSDTAKYFHAYYLSNTTRKYFFYEDGAGTYVLLDEVFDAPPTPNGTFFPFVYFRYNKVSEISDKTTDSYKTSKRLVKTLGIKYDQVATAINENPDITDVEQAILMFAVPANTENQMERRYLWDFFNAMYLSRVANPPAEGEALSGFSGSGIAIQDARFKMWLENDGLAKRTVTGSVGPVGSYGSTFATVDKIVNAIDESTGQPIQLVTQVTAHFYRKQITSNSYVELEVQGMRTVFEIFQGYSAIADEQDPILIIPIDRAIAENYPLPKREELYSRAMHYVFNSRVTQKVKWYQTSWFRIVLIIVMIIVTFITQGATAKELIALIQAGAYLAAAYLVLVQIIQIILFRAIFRVLVKALGPEAALILAIIAAALGVADAFSSGSLSGAPFASDLLAFSSGLTSAINADMRAKFDQLIEEYDSFKEYAEEKKKLLDTANDLLGDVTRLSPFIIFGESPDDYYNRTVHSGNIGVLSIDAISEFVNVKLKLPTLNDSFGGITDD